MSLAFEPPKPHPCDPPIPERSSRRSIAGGSALLMVLLGLWMGLGLREYPCEHAFFNGIDSPVLAVELASNARELRTVTLPACLAQINNVTDTDKGSTLARLQSEARSALWRNTAQDCFFIPLYTSFLVAFGFLFADRKDTANKILRFGLLFLMILTALMDYLENRGIFLDLRLGPSDSVAQQTSLPSRCKWALLGTGLLLTFVILRRSNNAIYSLATRRLFALGYLVGGSMIIGGLWRPTLIELAMKLFGLMVIVNLFALLGAYFSRKPKDEYKGRKPVPGDANA
jgi:hypothetical protein